MKRLLDQIHPAVLGVLFPVAAFFVMPPIIVLWMWWAEVWKALAP